MATLTRKRKPKTKPLPTIWEVSDDLWERIQPILLDSGRVSPPVDATSPTGDGPSTGSSSGCAAVASGTNCRASSVPRARSMTGSSAGAKAV